MKIIYNVISFNTIKKKINTILEKCFLFEHRYYHPNRNRLLQQTKSTVSLNINYIFFDFASLLAAGHNLRTHDIKFFCSKKT